jgi:hypothetical protein
MTIFSGDYQEAVEEVVRTAFTMAAVTSRDNHASMSTKTTFAGASSLSRRLAPPIAGLADDINGLTDPINDARGTEQ